MKFKLLIYILLGSFMSTQAQTVIFSENFETGTLPLGWSTQQETGSVGWQVGNSLTQSSPYFNIPTHSLFAASNDDACNCDMSNDLLISPMINLSTTLFPKLNFSAFYTGAYNSKAEILISTDNITWTTLQNISAHPSWLTHTIDLTHYAGQSSVYLAFKHDDDGAWASGIAIDDVLITDRIFVGNTILYEGFNACALPAGWGQFELQGGFGFEIATTDSISGGGLNIPPHTGCVAGLNDAKHDGASGTLNVVDDYLHTPALDFTNYSSVFLDFDAWVVRGKRFYMDVQVSTDSINWTYVEGIYSIDGWLPFTVDLTNWAGEPKVYIGFSGIDYNFPNSHGAGAIDNIHIYEPPTHDLEITTVFPDKYMEIGKQAIRGKIKNLGGDTIHSVDVHWQINNGLIHSQTLVGLNYIPLSVNDFEFDDSLDINTIGIHDLKVWLSKPNGLSDLNPSNDSIFINMNVLPYLPQKRVVVEEHTAAWCTSCPTAIDSTFAFSQANPEAIIVAIHNGDIMSYGNGNIIAWGLGLQGLPSIMIDRYKYPLPRGLWLHPYKRIDKAYLDRRDLIDPVEVTFLQKSYNSVTKELTVEVNAEFFVDYPNDDLRLNVTITEDSVSNEFDSNYDQANTTGFPYYHRHVARATLDGAWGVQGSLPASVTVGNYSKLFTWTVPDSFNLDHLEIIGMVHRHSDNSYNRAILNANSIAFNASLMPTTVEQVPTANTPNINVYPNPFSDNLIVTFNLETTSNVSIQVVNAIGQEIGNFPPTEMASGRQMVRMKEYLNSNFLQEGIYFINIKLGDNQFTKELIYQK